MIFIDLAGKQPPKEWLDRAEAARVKLMAIDDPEERKKFIEAHAQIWRDLAEWLKELSHRKCWPASWGLTNPQSVARLR